MITMSEYDGNKVKEKVRRRNSMKKTIWTSITAIICVVLVSLSLKDGVTKIADAKVEAASIAAESAMNNGGDMGGLDAGLDMGGSLDAGMDTGMDAGTATPDAGTATPDAGTATPDAGTATPDAGSNAGATDAKKDPTAPAEVVAYYNNAINKVIAEKAGYKKTRVTDMKKLEGGALLDIPVVVEMVNDFLGVGTTEYENKKGKAEFLSKASLTVADLTGAKNDVSGDTYTITLTLKNGQSQAATGGTPSDNTPLQRSGLYVGKGDKKAFDYKSSENIHTAINGVDNCTAESAKEQVSNAKIVAKINSKTGQMTELTVTWDWSVQLTKVKYLVASVKTADGTASSTVKVSNFQW